MDWPLCRDVKGLVSNRNHAGPGTRTVSNDGSDFDLEPVLSVLDPVPIRGHQRIGIQFQNRF